MIEDVARLRLTVDSTGIDSARAKLNNLGRDGGRASDSLGKLNKNALATKLAMGAVAVSVGAVAVAVAKTTKAWIQFNVAMKEVETIAGATKGEMKALRLEALKVAQSVGVDATEAAQGFYQAISAGVPTEDVAKFVKVAAELGKGGLADIGSSTDLLTTALNSYGKSADDARKVSDQLFRTVKLGKTNIPQLASSLARVAPVAASAGVSLEELLGITASTTKQGVKTAESMTQVKAAIVALLNPSETMSDIYEKLGVSSGRALIEQEGLAGALQKVRQQAGGDDKVLTQALRSIEAFSLSASITGEKLQETSDATKEIGEAIGDTAKASKIAGETIGTAFSKLGGSLLILAENFDKATDASESLTKSISDFADFLADPDLLDAYIESLQRFPAIMGNWIFFGKNAQDQVEEFSSEVQNGTDIQNEYNKSLAESARIREASSGGALGVAKKVLNIEKAIAIQKQINAGLDGKNGKVAERERQALKDLEEQLKYYISIGEQGDVLAKAQFEIALKVADVNDKLRRGKISTDEWKKSTEKLKKEYNNLGNTIIKTAEGADSHFSKILGINNDLIVVGEKATDIANTERAIRVLIKEQAGEEIVLLEKKLDLFDKLTNAGKTLTDEQIALKNVYEKQLGILKEQNKEAGKSKATLDFEGLQSRYRSKEEQASLEYSKDVGIIAQGGGSQEEQELLMQRARERFEEALAEKEDQGVGRATDLQSGINQDASSISLDYIDDDPYQAEIERLKVFEQEKLEVITEATNLQEKTRQDITRRIQDETTKKIKAVEQAQFQDRLSTASNFFGDLATVSESFGKKGAEIAKGFAIVQATIDTYASAVAAYKSTVGIPVVGPTLAPVAAAAAIAAGLANVRAIKSQKYQMGGIVSGSSYGGDQINAKLNSGEMVLNQTQQKNLFAMANNPIGSGSNQKGGVTIINQTGSDITGEVEENDEGDLEIVIQKAVKQAKDELTNEANYGGGTFLPSLEKNYGIART